MRRVRCSKKNGPVLGSPMSEMSDKSRRRRLRRRLTRGGAAGGRPEKCRGRPGRHADAGAAGRGWPINRSPRCRTGQQLCETASASPPRRQPVGVQGRGPSSIGVGEASVFFQVSTGRMPAMRLEAVAPRERRPSTARRSTRSVPTCRPTAAVRWSPATPRRGRQQVADRHRPGPVAATCSASTARRATTSPARAVPVLRRYAPGSDGRQPTEIYTAMLTGPQNMPKFSDRQLSPEEKGTSSPYVRMAAHTPNPRWLRAGWLRPRTRGHGDLDHRHGRRHRRGVVDRGEGMSDEREAEADRA